MNDRPRMTRTGLLAAIVVLGLAVAGVAAQAQRPRIPPTGTLEKVRGNLYKIAGAGSNTTVFITAAGGRILPECPAHASWNRRKRARR